MTDIQQFLILAFVFGIPAFFTICAVSLSGRISREEEETGAPEGMVRHFMESDHG